MYVHCTFHVLQRTRTSSTTTVSQLLSRSSVTKSPVHPENHRHVLAGFIYSMISHSSIGSWHNATYSNGYTWFQLARAVFDKFTKAEEEVDHHHHHRHPLFGQHRNRTAIQFMTKTVWPFNKNDDSSEPNGMEKACAGLNALFFRQHEEDTVRHYQDVIDCVKAYQLQMYTRETVVRYVHLKC